MAPPSRLSRLLAAGARAMVDAEADIASARITGTVEVEAILDAVRIDLDTAAWRTEVAISVARSQPVVYLPHLPQLPPEVRMLPAPAGYVRPFPVCVGRPWDGGRVDEGGRRARLMATLARGLGEPTVQLPQIDRDAPTVWLVGGQTAELPVVDDWPEVPAP